MSAIIGRLSTINPMADGIVSNNVKRIDEETVRRNSSRFSSVAALEATGKVAVEIATPKIPKGSKIMRKAYANHETRPEPSDVAKLVLTTRLTWRAADPMIAGAINRIICRTPGSLKLIIGRQR